MTDEARRVVDESQLRPVVDAAEHQNKRGRWIGALSAVLGALPAFLLAFEMIDWTGDQIAAYTAFLGVATGAVAVVLGVSDMRTALRVESEVTPVRYPRDDALVPLVPIADDGMDD